MVRIGLRSAAGHRPVTLREARILLRERHGAGANGCDSLRAKYAPAPFVKPREPAEEVVSWLPKEQSGF